MHVLSLKSLASLVLSVTLGTLGGWVAHLLGAPMPFLLGAFAVSAAVTLADIRLLGIAPGMPMPFRNMFVAVIGVTIGGSFQAGMLSDPGQLWLPALGVLVFVVLAQAVNYVIFRVLGGYDPATAFFSAMPGGLIEAIAMGERAGGDLQTVSLQQFARIALVITMLPFLFLIWTGQQVGSAAGMSLTSPGHEMATQDAFVLLFCAVVGLYGGRALRLPASILVGPLILSAVAHYYGLTEAGPPPWAISTAQIIVGAGLGARFRGFQLARIGKAFLLALLSVTAMLLIDAGLVFLLLFFVDQPFQVLLISFAPGGVTETALIALSLNANPVYVTTLHVFRIIVTVFMGAIGARILSKRAQH